MDRANGPATARFEDLCRHWRRRRKLSQLELALAADVSQRHLSWLETGRARPSRAMVVRLAEAMDVPLRQRNLLLRAAGFADLYPERRLDEPAMAGLLDALRRTLDHHEPFPAFVIDRSWQVRLRNRAAARMLALAASGLDEADLRDEPDAVGNVAFLSLHPRALRRHLRNWDALAPGFVHRLRSELAAGGDPTANARIERWIALAEPLPRPATEPELTPVLPLELAIGGVRLRLFSVIMTFGTPLDVTADELRIEAFHPADAATEEWLRTGPEDA